MGNNDNRAKRHKDVPHRICRGGRYGDDVGVVGCSLRVSSGNYLILRKLNTTYALLLGSSFWLFDWRRWFCEYHKYYWEGTQSVMGTVVRVLAAGVLAGVMMESGAADRIAQTIVGVSANTWQYCLWLSPP